MQQTRLRQLVKRVTNFQGVFFFFLSTPPPAALPEGGHGAAWQQGDWQAEKTEAENALFCVCRSGGGCVPV